MNFHTRIFPPKKCLCKVTQTLKSHIKKVVLHKSLCNSQISILLKCKVFHSESKNPEIKQVCGSLCVFVPYHNGHHVLKLPICERNATYKQTREYIMEHAL